MIIVAVSGGFDPVHVGHLKLFKAAKALGDKLIVIVHTDEWLKRKKGKVFMSLWDRMEIIKGFKCVDWVYYCDGGEDSAGGMISMLQPDILANGGDRTCPEEIDEAKACKRIGCKMVFNVGGGKIRSSSEMLENYNS